MTLWADALAASLIQAGDGEVTRALLTGWGAAADDMNPEAFARWIDAVMQFGRVERKRLSYNGAVRCLPGEAAHWRDPLSCVTYRDPGNSTYAHALHAACLYAVTPPEGLDAYAASTLGDVMEIGLALAWLAPSPENVSFRNRIERLVWATERTETRLGWVLGASTPRTWASLVDDLRIALGRRLAQPWASAQPQDPALDL